MNSTWADNSKARNLLEWQPTVSIDEGLQACVDWYLENVSWLKDISLETAPKVLMPESGLLPD